MFNQIRDLAFVIKGLIKDRTGNESTLTVEKDDEGRGALRTVDAAPFGYDEVKNAKRVTNVDAPRSKMEEIASVRALSVNPGEQKDITGVIAPDKRFTAFAVLVRSDGNHEWDLIIGYQIDNPSISSLAFGPAVLRRTNHDRGVLYPTDELAQRLGEKFYMRMYNKGTETRNYDIVVYGVER